MNKVVNRLPPRQKFSGLVGVLVIWTGITLGMHMAGLKIVDPRPISYLGVNPQTAGLFSFSLLLSSSLFVVFAFTLRSQFQLNNHFIQFFIIGQLGQAAAAVIPYGGRYKLAHTIAAYILAFSLPFLIQQFAKATAQSQRSSLYRRLLVLEIFTFIMGIGIFTFTKGIAPLGEALPAIGFHIWIIVVTFTMPKQ